jgi:hypothetical protein
MNLMSALTPKNKVSEQKPLSFFEIVGQALSLMFALQNKEGRKKMMDLAEDKPLVIVISGIVAMSIFFTTCFVGSQLVLHLALGS